jgi:hypothetical protein
MWLWSLGLGIAISWIFGGWPGVGGAIFLAVVGEPLVWYLKKHPLQLSAWLLVCGVFGAILGATVGLVQGFRNPLPVEAGGSPGGVVAISSLEAVEGIALGIWVGAVICGVLGLFLGTTIWSVNRVVNWLRGTR